MSESEHYIGCENVHLDCALKLLKESEGREWEMRTAVKLAHDSLVARDSPTYAIHKLAPFVASEEKKADG